MSEYWKSTPKYWCKHCSVYVRDTKLERTNHESTGRHQGAIKRSLRELHRSHEQEEREKERAKREVERLNGVVSGSGGSSSARPGLGTGAGAAPAARGTYDGAGGSQQATQAQRQAQLEQLSAMGVEIPTEYRPSMALAGGWTVTSTRVIKDATDGDGDSKDGNDDGSVEKRARGIRKREADETEEQQEERAAMEGLFKKRKTWGGPKAMPEADAELDALLSGDLVPKKEELEEGSEVKREEGEPELDDANRHTPSAVADVKPDPDVTDAKAVSGIPDDGRDPGPAAPAVIFKKRKPKNVRQK